MSPPPIRVHIVMPALLAWGTARLVESAAPQLVVAGLSGDGAACAQALAQTQPDVVLLDVDAPGAQQWVAELHQQTPARLLLLSDTRDADTLDAMVLAGARGVLSKHEQPDTLLKAIEKVHAGEMWLDRHATGRVFMAMARQHKATHTAAAPEQAKIASLTRRERQMVAALAKRAGATGKELAAALHISEGTLRNHLTSIYEKLDVKNRMELFAFAQAHRLVDA